MSKLRKQLSTFHVENVYNFDETGLFLQAASPSHVHYQVREEEDSVWHEEHEREGPYYSVRVHQLRRLKEALHGH